MTSVQADFSSAHPVDEIPCLSDVQLSNLHGASSSAGRQDFESRLGGKFSADLTALLGRQSLENRVQPAELQCKKSSELTPRQFALIRIQAGNVEGAIDFIQRHAPDQTDWLNTQLKFHKLQQSDTTPRTPFPHIRAVYQTVLIDAEAGRLAKVIGQFGVFRAWAYAHANDNGDGWAERQQLEAVWDDAGIARSKRHRRRLLRDGIEWGYWTYDERTDRVYLSGQARVAKRLVKSAITDGYRHNLETNKPGRRRIAVDLSGTLQEASARLYAAWFAGKDPDQIGTTISRDALCTLWNVSVPTLLKWERINQLHKQSNYAQQNDTSIDRVPAHAYLTLNRDGSHSAAWRLPNTYTSRDHSIQQHPRTGKSRKIRKAVQRELVQAEQRGALGDAALPGSSKLYFVEHRQSKVDPFKACSDYLRKLSRRDGDMKSRRYFYVGQRHSIRIFEPYNPVSNLPETDLSQRLIWGESTVEFEQVRLSYATAVKDHA